MPLKFLFFPATAKRPIEKAIELRNKLGAVVPNNGVYSIMLRTEVNKVLTEWKGLEIGLRCDQNALESFPYLVLFVAEQQQQQVSNGGGKNGGGTSSVYPQNNLFYEFAKSFEDGGPNRAMYRGDIALFKVSHSDRAIIFNLCNCTLKMDYDFVDSDNSNNNHSKDNAHVGEDKNTSTVKTVVASTTILKLKEGTSPDNNKKNKKKKNKSKKVKKITTLKNDNSSGKSSSTTSAQIIEEEQDNDSYSVKSRSSSFCESLVYPESSELYDESDGEIDEVDLISISDQMDMINVTNWKQRITDLIDKAEDEVWSCSSSTPPEVVLFHYIHCLFLHVMKTIEEQRECNNSFALTRVENKTRLIFNTGLKERGYLVSSGECLYAILERVEYSDGVQWHILDFAPYTSCVLRYQFESMKPDLIKFYPDRELVFDVNRDLEMNWSQLMQSNLRPTFLSNEWQLKIFLNGYLKSYLYPMLIHNPEIAVPAVYKRRNQTLGLEFLLPLCCKEPHRVDLVLVVRPIRNGYIAHSLLFTDWAYTLARCLSPIQANSWIKTKSL
jgi:hypothetical protein